MSSEENAVAVSEQPENVDNSSEIQVKVFFLAAC